MRRLIKKTFLFMGEMFYIAPRGKSDAWRRLADMRKQLSPERDFYALRGDFYNVGKYIRKGMEKYERTSV